MLIDFADAIGVSGSAGVPLGGQGMAMLTEPRPFLCLCA